MDPVYETSACFRALVEAMSRPGTVAQAPIEPADHAVLATLADHEVSLSTPDETIRTALANENRLTEAEPERAAIVHAPDPAECPVRDLERGTLKEPSDGATVIYRVTDLLEDSARPSGANRAGDTNGPADANGTGDTILELSGPGVPERRTLAVRGWSRSGVNALADAQSSHPCGVDAVLTTDRKIAAIPRSVDVEVA